MCIRTYCFLDSLLVCFLTCFVIFIFISLLRYFLSLLCFNCSLVPCVFVFFLICFLIPCFICIQVERKSRDIQRYFVNYLYSLFNYSRRVYNVCVYMPSGTSASLPHKDPIKVLSHQRLSSMRSCSLSESNKL